MASSSLLPWVSCRWHWVVCWRQEAQFFPCLFGHAVLQLRYCLGGFCRRVSLMESRCVLPREACGLVFITTRPHCWKILSPGPQFLFWQSCSPACLCPDLIVAELLHGLHKPRGLSWCLWVKCCCISAATLIPHLQLHPSWFVIIANLLRAYSIILPWLLIRTSKSIGLSISPWGMTLAPGYHLDFVHLMTALST